MTTATKEETTSKALGPKEKDNPRKPSPLRSIIAGSIGGAVEISLLYPAEFAKVRKLA